MNDKDNKRSYDAATSKMSRRALVEDVGVRRRCYLEVSGLKVNLDEGEALLGRDESCAVHLPLEGVSRKHCRVFYQDGEYYVEDLESTNGTYLNNVKIVQGVLRGGDIISLGNVKVVYREDKVQD